MWIFAFAILTNYLITKCSFHICTVAQHCCIRVMFQLVPINTCAYCIIGSPGNECQHFAADEKRVEVCVVFFVQCKTWSLNLLLSPWQLEWCCLCLDSVSWTHLGKKDERKCLKKKVFVTTLASCTHVLLRVVVSLQSKKSHISRHSPGHHYSLG